MKKWTKWILPGAVLAGVVMGTVVQAAEKVSVGTLKMAALTNPWVAKQQGIFEKNGLDVTLVEFTNGAAAIAAQQSGDIQILLSIPGTAMIAVERGFDLVAIFQNEIAHKTTPDSGSIEVAAASNLKTLSDLAGKKVVVGGLHSQQTVDAQIVLKRAGVDISGVQWIEMPYPTHATALKSGQIDAVVTVDPFTTQLVTSGVGRVLSWVYVDSLPEQPLGAWYARSTYVNKNPQLIEAFTKSMKESIDYMNADADRARAEVVAYTNLDPGLVKDMPMIAWDYHVHPDKWQDVIDMMQKNGELQKPHKAAEFFAPQLKPYIAE